MSDKGNEVGARSKPGRIKRWHPKTNRGCTNCRRRRVKCTEERPQCVACARRKEECRYQSETQTSPDSKPAEDESEQDSSPVRFRAPTSYALSSHSDDISIESPYPQDVNNPTPTVYEAAGPYNSGIDISPSNHVHTASSTVDISQTTLQIEALFSPTALCPFFTSTEQLYLFHHYLQVSAHSLLVISTKMVSNPWITLHARLALRTPSDSNLTENALRKAILAFAAFEVGLGQTDSGFITNDQGETTENSFIQQSRAQREESLELLLLKLLAGQPGPDDIDVALATCLSLLTLDRIAAGVDWYRPLQIACTMIKNNGGPKAFIAARDTPTRRFICEQITCFDVIGSFTKDMIPSLLEAWDDWWYDDLPESHIDSVSGGFGVDRGLMEYLARVARVNSTAQDLYKLAPHARRSYHARVFNSKDSVIDPFICDLRNKVESDVAQLLLEAPFWQTFTSVSNIPRIALGNCLMSHAITIHLLWTTVCVPVSDPRISRAVKAILDMLDDLEPNTVTRGLLAALGQAAFCAIGPERLRARSLLNKLAPAHTRDLTRSLIVVNMLSIAEVIPQMTGKVLCLVVDCLPFLSESWSFRDRLLYVILDGATCLVYSFIRERVLATPLSIASAFDMSNNDRSSSWFSSSAMSINASVLVRRSLRWPPAPAEEESSDVLYLKAGNYFADLRVFKRGQPVIDWSMGGTCLTVSGSNDDVRRLRFINVVDSRALATSPSPNLTPALNYVDPYISSQDLSAPDQYDVQMAKTSSSSTFIETGSMPNPQSSDPDVNADFEEIWHALELPLGSEVIFMETINDHETLGKGFLVKVGAWQLGLLDDGKGQYFAWREDEFSGQTRNIYIFGEGAKEKVLPLRSVSPNWKSGETVSHGGREWIIRELGSSAVPNGIPVWA